MGKNSRVHHRANQQKQSRRDKRMSNQTNNGNVTNLPGTVGSPAPDTQNTYNGPITAKYQGTPLITRPRNDAGALIGGLNNLRKMIVFSQQAYDKQCYFIGHCEKEIGWLGIVEEYESMYYVEDVFLFDQEVTGGETDIKAESLADFYEKVMEDLGFEEGNKFLKKLRFWGHSHVRMGIGPSATDESTLKELFRPEFDFFIRVIGNKEGLMKADLYRQFHTQELEAPLQFTWLDTSWDVAFVREEPAEGLLEEMRTKVKGKVYKQEPVRHSNYQGPYGTGGNFGGVNVRNPTGTTKNDEKKMESSTISGRTMTSTDSVEFEEKLESQEELWWTHVYTMSDFYDRFFGGRQTSSFNFDDTSKTPVIVV